MRYNTCHHHSNNVSFYIAPQCILINYALCVNDLLKSNRNVILMVTYRFADISNSNNAMQICPLWHHLPSSLDHPLNMLIFPWCLIYINAISRSNLPTFTQCCGQNAWIFFTSPLCFDLFGEIQARRKESFLQVVEQLADKDSEGFKS